MVMVTVIMNMVYLTTETRTRVGEPGINDPNIKICVTCITFFILWFLIQSGYIDPSDWDNNEMQSRKPNTTSTRSLFNQSFVDVNLPLLEVCYTQSRAGRGILIFTMLVIFCLGFVIFVTSAQSYSGCKAMCCGGCADKEGEADGELIESANRTRSFVRNPAPVDEANASMPIAARDPFHDRVKGQLLLFTIFLLIVIVVVIFFTFAQFYAAEGTRTNEENWQEACHNYDRTRLLELGLS